MNFKECCGADVTGGTGRCTFCNAVIVTENHLRFVIGRHIERKRLQITSY